MFPKKLVIYIVVVVAGTIVAQRASPSPFSQEIVPNKAKSFQANSSSKTHGGGVSKLEQTKSEADVHANQPVCLVRILK